MSDELRSFMFRDPEGVDARRNKPRAHERRVASELGGRIQPASGAIEGFKGDVSGVDAGAFDFLIECKRTVHGSLGVKGMWLEKIAKEAEAAGKYPALDIQIEKMRGENEWIAIPRSTFKRMLKVLREHDEVG